MTKTPKIRWAVLSLLYLISLCLLGLFFWVVWETQTALEQQRPVVEVQSGLRYLLMPLMLPVLHLVSALTKNSPGKKARKAQAAAFIGCILSLLALGWITETLIDNQAAAIGYEVCSSEHIGYKSIVTVYGLGKEQCL